METASADQLQMGYDRYDRRVERWLTQAGRNRYNTSAIARLLLFCRTGDDFAGEGREKIVSEVRVKENESLDSALRRFKRSCARSGVLAEVRKREHYEKPSVKRKKKSEAARKRKR